jgi:hypothetical protein
MNKLSKFLQMVDYFYKLATGNLDDNNAETWTMPDDPEDDEDSPSTERNPGPGLYDEIEALSRQVSSHELGRDLHILAEMYKKALELNTGFEVIARSIKVIMDLYLDEDSGEFEENEVDEIESILDKVYADLRDRKGSPININENTSPQILAEFKKVKSEVARQEAEEAERNIEEGIDLPTEEERLRSYMGEVVDQKGHQLSDQVYNPNEGGDKDKGTQGSGHGFKKKELKDWIEQLANQVKSYSDRSKFEKNVVARKRFANLSENIIPKMIENIRQQSNIRFSGQDYTEEGQTKLTQLAQEFATLRKEYKLNRDNVFYYDREVSGNILAKELENIKDPYQKLAMQQEMELLKSLSQRDYNKDKEIKLRRALIRALRGGKVSQPTIDNMLSKIEEAKKLRKPIEEVRKEFTIERRNLKDSATLKGYLEMLGEKLATQKAEFRSKHSDPVKKAIKKKILAEEYVAFKEYMDALTEAELRGDAAAVKEITKHLNKAIIAYAESLPVVQEFNRHLDKFRTYRTQIIQLESSKVLENETIPEPIKEHLKSLVQEGKDLVNAYNSKAYFGPIVEWNLKILNAIEERLQDE